MDLAGGRTAVDETEARRGTGIDAPPTAVAAPVETRTTNRLKASIVDLTFLIWAVATPVALGGQLLNSDGDAARHLAMGEHLLQHGWIERDVFSFTKASEPLVAYEWLSQIVYALFHRLGGIAGVAICGGLMIATAYALLVLFLRRRGVDPLLAYLTGIAAAVLGSVHWLARPHLFTYVALALLLFLIESDRRRVAWLFAPLFLIWANLHPGFVIGFMILVVYVLGELVEAWRAGGDSSDERGKWLARARLHASAIVIGLAATLINPHGWTLHRHVASLLGNRYLIDVTSEFMSPSFHMLHGKVFLVMLLMIVTALVLHRERLSFPHLFLLLFMLASALFAQRNIPLFGLVILPALALELDGSWRRLNLRVLNHVRRVFREGEALGAPGLWIAPVALSMLLLAWNHGRVLGVPAVKDSFDPARFPVEAVSFARQAGIGGRVYHELTWGGYILFAWPGQKIFIDGLTDFFGEDLVKDYIKIAAVEPDWDRALDAYDISVALIPVKGALAYALEHDGWERVYRDRTAVILRRR